MMTIDKFNEKYSIQGGFPQLYRMRYEKHLSVNEIAKYFGVSRRSISSYLHDIFGKDIDSRIERRTQRVNRMIEYMRTHSEEESYKTFEFENREYYTEALFLAYQQDIYQEQTPFQLQIPQENHIIA